MDKKIILTYESDYIQSWVRVVEVSERFMVQYRWSEPKNSWLNHLRRCDLSALYDSRGAAFAAARRLFLNKHPEPTYGIPAFQKISYDNEQEFRKWFKSINGYWPINHQGYWLIPKKDQGLYVKMKWGH